MNRHTVIVRRPGEVDRYGDPVEGSDTQFSVEGCVLAPRASSEVRNYSDTVLSEFTLLAPAGAGITATDELIVDGQRYSVEGEPTEWSSPFEEWAPGVQVALRRVRG